MGGWGSGSYYRMGRSGKRTAEGSLPLDIRVLKRKGLLTPGGTITSKWSRGGNVPSVSGRLSIKIICCCGTPTKRLKTLNRSFILPDLQIGN